MATRNRLNITDEIQAQTQRVHAAYERWEIAFDDYSEAAWLAYQSELSRLNALVKEAKRNSVAV